MDTQVIKRAGEDGLGGGEGKRPRKSMKKQPPKPPPLPQPNSSDTPPEDDPLLDIPPPPPSERKIARRRPSVRAAARAFTPEEESPSTIKRRKLGPTASATSGVDSHPPNGASSSGAHNHASTSDPSASGSSSSAPRRQEFFSGSTSGSSRPDIPRPLSPPLALGASISRRKSSMGPPSEPFVRKTRKSMSRMGLLPADVNGDGDTEVPLPESETPMIRKNRQLREDQSRRSSLGMRGQRASSSLGRGEISIPHPSVESSHFHKHISPILPEPIRCRHLLVFCAKRAADEHLVEAKSKGKSKDKGKSRYQGERTDEGDKLVKEIMDSFLSGLGKGEVETNVFSSGGHAISGLSLRPHPQNVINREQEAKAEAVIRKCKSEKSTWRSIKTQTKKRQEDVVTTLRAKSAKQLKEDKPELSGMEDWMKDALGLADGIIAEDVGSLGNMGEFADVEFKVDMLHQSTHSALQYSLQATRFLDGIFSTLASDLRTRDPTRSGRSAETDGGPDAASLLAAATTSTLPSSSAVTSKPRTDPINMLRALAAAEQKSQDGAGLAAAKRVQPVSASTLALGMSTSTAPSSIPPAQTPRRAAPTPRRTGALAASTNMPSGTEGARGRMYGRGTPAAAE